MGTEMKKGARSPFFFLAVAPAAKLLATACLLAATTQSSGKMRGPGRIQTLQRYYKYLNTQHYC